MKRTASFKKHSPRSWIQSLVLKKKISVTVPKKTKQKKRGGSAHYAAGTVPTAFHVPPISGSQHPSRVKRKPHRLVSHTTAFHKRSRSTACISLHLPGHRPSPGWGHRDLPSTLFSCPAAPYWQPVPLHRQTSLYNPIWTCCLSFPSSYNRMCPVPSKTNSPSVLGGLPSGVQGLPPTCNSLLFHLHYISLPFNSIMVAPKELGI